MLRTLRHTLLALALTAPAAAQSARGTAVGLGVALNPIALGDLDTDATMLPVGLGNFTVPIRVGSRLRLEPELGILRAHSEASGGGFSGGSTATLLRYGIAAHFMMAGTDDFQPYIGPRLGFIRSSTRQESSGSPANEDKRTDHYLGVAIGGEYWLTSRFSLGAEVQINRVGIGRDSDVPSSMDSSASFLSNNGVISVRFYL
jgi:hypothetical protein